MNQGDFFVLLSNPFIASGLIILLGVLFIAVMYLLFRRLPMRGSGLHRRFFEQMIRLIVITICLVRIIQVFDPTISITTTLIRGSALVVAIVGFAAQPVIADLVSGLLISINKPFDIGDRIIPDGMEPGVVEDINLRHTVLRIYDDQRIVIPNSQLNTKAIVNTSYRMERRGIHLTYGVSFDTDIQRASDLIRDAVASSPYTLEVEYNGFKEDSGPVYFLRFAESALILETTIWVKPPTSNYIATTDVNTRVLNLFRKNGIEIPYGYLNVLTQERKANEPAPSAASQKEAAKPSKRHYRSDTVTMTSDSSTPKKVLDLAEKYALKQRMSSRDAMHLRLLTEEATACVKNIMDSLRTSLWIDGSGVAYKIHLSVRTKVDPETYQRLLSLSSSGKNAAVKNLSDKIQEMILIGSKPSSDSSDEETQDLSWSLREYEEMSPEEAQSGMSQTILATLADDVRVSVLKDRVDVVVAKDTRK